MSIQVGLRDRLLLSERRSGKARFVAGADISYSKGDDRFFAAVVVLDTGTLQTVTQTVHAERVRFPYIPGLLSFREGPPLLKAFEKLDVAPDVVLFDGQGIAHPRGLGLASHLGLFLDVPAIGCAKTRLVGEHGEPGKEAGSRTDLVLEGRVVGAVLRTKTGVKPVFVSQGHRIGLKRSVDIVLSCCGGYRIPEPVRRAHLLVNEIRRQAAGDRKV